MTAILRFIPLLLFCLAAQAADLGTITLANGDWPPYMGRDLPHYGGASRIVTESFASQDIQVEYRFFPWKRALEEARQGSVDGTLIWAKTPEREADFLFSNEIVSTHVVLFHAKSRPIQWQNLRDLARYRLGGTLGYAYGAEYDSLAAAGILKMELASSDEINLRKIAANHLDVAPVDRDVALYLLATRLHDVADQLAYDPREVGIAPHYLLISKKSPNAADLIRRFNVGLSQLQSSGRLAQLQAGLPQASQP